MAEGATVTAETVARVFRAESGRAVASLVRVFGDIDTAEDAVQEAFEVALRRWPDAGLPPSPAGWIITTARNRGIDRVRREGRRDDVQHAATRLAEQTRPDEPEEVGAVEDERLRLIFTCCHPALALHTQVALTLRLVAGLQTGEIATAFLVPEATMAQRLVRAKGKIRAANIPYRVPAEPDLPDRLAAVLAVVYLVFNEGHTRTTGDELVRDDLCHEAVRLARLLVALMPDEPEAWGLLALLLLTAARRPARTDADGGLVRLADQDRGRWDSALIAEGHDIVRRCLRWNVPGPYQIQAAIAAVHADARRAADTDWSQIEALYGQLAAFTPTPIVLLNRAVATAEMHGPEAGLSALDEVAVPLDGHHLYWAVRADLLERLGDLDTAESAYDRALELVANNAERDHLQRRRRAVTRS